VIPILDLTRQYRSIEAEIGRAVGQVLASGHFINGPNVEALEREIAGYVGTDHAVGLNSGTDALHLALRALGIGPGDEVITTPFSFVATTEAIVMVGATPVFADIDPHTFNLDPDAVAAAITPRTRALVPVHLYGRPAPMDELCAIAAKHQLAVVEDCAQAIGARIDGRGVGSLGTIGCLSFFPSKNLGAYGDGGMIVTGDGLLAAKIRRLRAHGAAVKYYHDELGVNSRLDELQAAILRAKLPHLEEWIDQRTAVARRYFDGIDSLPQLACERPPGSVRHVFHQFTVRVRDAERDRVAAVLRERGVQTMIYYPVPLHLQALHADLGLREGAFPAAESAARDVLSLPMFPELTAPEIDAVLDALADATADRAVAAGR